MIKRLKRMFGISAPRMAVRAAIPWYLRWLGIAALTLLILLFSLATYDFGKRFAATSYARDHDHKVMDSSAYADSDHEPQQSRKEAELCSKNRSH